jgi:hypothetical protein
MDHYACQIITLGNAPCIEGGVVKMYGGTRLSGTKMSAQYLVVST